MSIQHRNRQQGVALVVSLVILVSLTLLGITAIQRTTTDLAMAGNQRETGLMFQAAEAGLVAAEVYIDASTTNNDFTDSSAGLHTVDADDTTYFSPNYFEDDTWTNSATKANTSLVSTFGVKEEPRYIIEYLGDRYQDPHSASLSSSFSGYGGPSSGMIVSIYRATARGVGLTGNSYRYVQSYKGKEAP